LGKHIHFHCTNFGARDIEFLLPVTPGITITDVKGVEVGHSTIIPVQAVEKRLLSVNGGGRNHGRGEC
jgi:hypothetical protein